MIQLTVGKGSFTLEWAPEEGGRRRKPFDSHLIVAYIASEWAPDDGGQR